MKIILEHPFNKRWKKAYLVTNKEPRRNVILFNSKQDRTTISYARYLMSVRLGRELPVNMLVDHINGDKMDDRIENMQLLTVKENNIKAIKQNNISKKMVDFICGTCGQFFTKPRNQTHLVKTSIKSTYCSRQCGGRHLKPSAIIREYRA